MRYTYEQPEYLDKVGVVHLVQQLKGYIDGIATGDIDLSDYVTKRELQAKLDALEIDIDLSSYATKEELQRAINNIDLSNYALKREIPSLDGYATTEYVVDAINNAQLSGDGSGVDLSIYAKKSDLNSKADIAHTHTISDITNYSAPDLSSYAKKTDIPSLSGYALKSEIPSIDGLATTEYVDNAVKDVTISGEVDLSDYYTKSEIDTAISSVAGKSAYEVYLDSKTYRFPKFGEIIEAEDGLYDTDNDDVDDCIRSGYNSNLITSILTQNVNMLDTTMVTLYDGTKETTAPYMDLVFCSNQSPTNCELNYKKQPGDYWYRFIYHTVYDVELGGRTKRWNLYLAHYDDNLEVVLKNINDLKVYDSYSTKLYTAVKVMTGSSARPVAHRTHPFYRIASSYQNAMQSVITELYSKFTFYMKVIPISQEEWLATLKGEDGDISFDSLTDEQKESLKGDKGDKGDKGVDGVNGQDGTNGKDGIDGYTPVRGTDYWTEDDINTIKSYINEELGVIENGSY